MMMTVTLTYPLLSLIQNLSPSIYADKTFDNCLIILVSYLCCFSLGYIAVDEVFVIFKVLYFTINFSYSYSISMILFFCGNICLFTFGDPRYFFAPLLSLSKIINLLSSSVISPASFLICSTR